jgi:hypothetical protein
MASHSAANRKNVFDTLTDFPPCFFAQYFSNSFGERLDAIQESVKTFLEGLCYADRYLVVGT